MYGLLAACAALVLLTSGSSSRAGSELVDLRGRTSSGFQIRLLVLDGKAHGFYTRAQVTCPGGESRDWRWFPFDGNPVPFHQEGPRFYVRERSEFPEQDPPSTLVSVMRAEFEDSGRVVRGTIRSRAVWGSGADAVSCAGRASFSARQRG